MDSKLWQKEKKRKREKKINLSLFWQNQVTKKKSYKKEWNKLRERNKEFLGKREKANMNIVLVVVTLKLSLMEVDTRPKKNRIESIVF